MLAKRLDARSCGPEKPLQGRIRRAPASRLPRARISRWIASENVRRYDWTASSGSVVANDPVNRSDPTGKQSIQDQQLQMQIDDMRQQGMSEQQIQQEIGRQAGIEAMALSIVVPAEGLLAKGIGLLGRALGIGEKAVDAAKAVPAIKAGSAGGETAGKAFPQAVRDAAKAENPSATCVYCRREATGTQVDHAIPRARGGDATIDNAQLACPHCNASKGARDFPVNPPPGYRGEWPPKHWFKD